MLKPTVSQFVCVCLTVCIYSLSVYLACCSRLLLGFWCIKFPHFKILNLFIVSCLPCFLFFTLFLLLVSVLLVGMVFSVWFMHYDLESCNSCWLVGWLKLIFSLPLFVSWLVVLFVDMHNDRRNKRTSNTARAYRQTQSHGYIVHKQQLVV